MKKTLLSFAFGLSMLTTLPALAQDVYVYNGTDTQSPIFVGDVRKIAFTDKGMTLTSANGQTKEVALADFSFFTFRQLAATGIKPVDVVAGLSVKVTGQTLRITSERPLQSVKLYTAAGALVDGLSVKAGQAVRNLSALPEGVYILKMTVDGKEYAKKFVK